MYMRAELAPTIVHIEEKSNGNAPLGGGEVVVLKPPATVCATSVGDCRSEVFTRTQSLFVSGKGLSPVPRRNEALGIEKCGTVGGQSSKGREKKWEGGWQRSVLGKERGHRSMNAGKGKKKAKKTKARGLTAIEVGSSKNDTVARMLSRQKDSSPMSDEKKPKRHERGRRATGEDHKRPKIAPARNRTKQGKKLTNLRSAW